MDGATLNALIYKGYAKGATHVGMPHAQYRAANAINPLSTTPIATIPAAFSVGGNFDNQSNPDQIIWQVVADGSQLAVGDYLVGAHAWAIIGMEELMPVMAMRCTDSITVARGSRSFTVQDGLMQSETIIGQNLPCYIQLKRDKGFSAPAGFPAPTNSSAPMPEWTVYLPLGGVTPAGFFREGDSITASDGQQWKIDAASSSTVIWQLACVPFEPNA